MRSWLKECRVKKGLTAKVVATKIGVSEGYYSLIENGKRQKRMDATLIAKLSFALEIPTQQIVELENR